MSEAIKRTPHPVGGEALAGAYAVLAEEYRIALAGYLAGAGETALRRAYDLARSALADGIGLLEFAVLHHRALQAALPGGLAPQEKATVLGAAANFLAESISPYEMAFRGFQEANNALRHINEVLEQEARRIAQLLHDDVGQLLFALHLAIAELGHRADPSLQPEVERAKYLAGKMEERLRQLSHEMRPTMLDDLGLIPALEFLADGVHKRSGIHITVSSSLAGRLSSSLDTVLYRVIQEGLTNVAKHSKATRAEVILEQRDGMLFCTVRDDGVGFDPENPANGSPGLGLIGMRERVDSMGGTLYVRSHPGQGTQLQMTIPVGG